MPTVNEVHSQQYPQTNTNPKDIRKEFFDNHAEFVKLDATKVKEEKEKIGEIEYKK